jgi:hypothetical protein
VSWVGPSTTKGDYSNYGYPNIAISTPWRRCIRAGIVYVSGAMGRTLVRGCRQLGKVVLVMLAMGILVEAGFRVAPGLIPESLLKRFDRNARVEIAARRFLPNETQTWEPVRTDDGPPIKLFNANSEIAYDFPDTGGHGRMRMDARGFCNPPTDSPDRSQIDLIAIGDSFTACHAPAPEVTWPSELGRLLGMTAYNLGRGGYGPYEYLQLLELFGIEKHPRVVVMQLYEGNDLRDAARYAAYRAASPTERSRFLDRAGWNPLRFEPAALLDNPMGRHSWAFDFAVVGLANAGSDLVDYLRPEPGRRVNFHYTARFPEGAVAMNVQNNDQDEVRSARELAAGTLSLSLLDGALDRFADLARQYGFAGIVSYAPAAYTAYADVVVFDDPSLAASMAEFSRAQRSYLADATAARGVPFVDLTPALQGAARARRGAELLYYPINVHYTPAGQRVVAETVAAAVRGLVKPSR